MAHVIGQKYRKLTCPHCYSIFIYTPDETECERSLYYYTSKIKCPKCNNICQEFDTFHPSNKFYTEYEREFNEPEEG